MPETTAQRLKKIMELRNLRQADIIRLAEPYCQRYRVKLNKSDLSQFVNGKNEPGQWKLTILGLALNVSEGWLMGLDIPMERKTPTPSEEDERSERMSAIFDSLPENRKNEALRYLEFLAGQEDKK